MTSPSNDPFHRHQNMHPATAHPRIPLPNTPSPHIHRQNASSSVRPNSNPCCMMMPAKDSCERVFESHSFHLANGYPSLRYVLIRFGIIIPIHLFTGIPLAWGCSYMSHSSFSKAKFIGSLRRRVEITRSRDRNTETSKIALGSSRVESPAGGSGEW